MSKTLCVMYLIAGSFALATAHSAFKTSESWELWIIIALLDFVNSGLYYKRIKEEQ